MSQVCFELINILTVACQIITQLLNVVRVSELCCAIVQVHCSFSKVLLKLRHPVAGRLQFFLKFAHVLSQCVPILVCLNELSLLLQLSVSAQGSSGGGRGARGGAKARQIRLHGQL